MSFPTFLFTIFYVKSFPLFKAVLSSSSSFIYIKLISLKSFVIILSSFQSSRMCSQHLSYIRLSFYLSAFFFTHLHLPLVSFALATLWLTFSAHIFNLLSDIRSASSMLEHLVMKALHYALLHLCAQIVFTFILFSFNLWPT